MPQQERNGWLLNKIEMNHKNREIVLLTQSGQKNEKALEKELENLDTVLRNAESPVIFCKTHELVNRNSITTNEAKLFNSFYKKELKPFRFLICKN